MSSSGNYELRLDPPKSEHDLNNQLEVKKESHSKLFYLMINKISPSVIVIIFLWGYTNPLIAMFGFHIISMMILPYVYTFYIDKEETFTADAYRKEIKRANLGKKANVILSVVLLLLFCGGLLGASLFALYVFPSLLDDVRLPLNVEPGLIFLFAFELGLVNPFLEEWFWRTFLIFCYSEKTWFRVSATLHYGLYHFFVILYISNWIYALLAVISITIAGFIFLFIKFRYGFLPAAFAHMGADLAIVAFAIILLADRGLI